MSPLLHTKNLSVAAAPGVRTAALRQLTLRINPGEHVAVIGASGAGKTTLLMALACAVQPLAGEIELFGLKPWQVRPSARQHLRGRLFLAPQVPPLPPRQRVVTAVLAGRLPHMSPWQSLRTLWQPSAHEAGLAQQALAAFDLADKLWARVDHLSGGERQRVALARALVSQAELWLLDEPLSALDPTRAERAITALQSAAQGAGRTLVCSLHQVAVARERFGRIVALRGGQCVYDGPAAALTDAQLHALYGHTLDDPAASPLPEPTATQLPNTMCR